jgi:mitochondrial import inner membrane translocase subunit TIM23
MLHPLLPREASCRIANLSAWRPSPNIVRSVQRRFLSSTRPNSLSSIRPRTAKTNSTIRLPFRLIRHDSTLAAGHAPTTLSPPSNGLTWNRFLELRKIRRRISLMSSVLFGIGTMVAGGAFVLSKELEVKVSQTVGIDQFITLGALFIICFAGGWLIGPFFGNALFNVRFRSMRKLINEVSATPSGSGVS